MKIMKSIVTSAAVAVIVGLSGVSIAEARKVCNFDPVCQAKRDGVSVETKLREQAQWRAAREPRSPNLYRGRRDVMRQ